MSAETARASEHLEKLNATRDKGRKVSDREQVGAEKKAVAAGPATGKQITTHWSMVDAVAAKYDATVLSDARYARDGNLVTAAGVSAGIDMALWHSSTATVCTASTATVSTGSTRLPPPSGGGLG